MRRVLFVIAVLTTLFVLLAWAADARWSNPLTPAERLAYEGDDFRSVMGTAAQDDQTLRIETLGEGSTALQSIVLNGIDAEQFRLLRYRFNGLPHTLELSLVFRRADSPDDVHAVLLPWARDGDNWFDLRHVEEWSGRITELGFAEYPTPQIVPSSQTFEPFSLVEAELLSPSWRGDFAALGSDWLGYWPWSQRSVHALGRDTDLPRAESMSLIVALALAAMVFWAALLLRLRGLPLLQFCAVVIAAGWLLLDAHWHAGLRWRHIGTQAQYAAFAWPERETKLGDNDLHAVARDLKALLRDEPDETRILVHASTSFAQLRLVYHLLPLNVAVLAQVIAATDVPIPAGSLIVVYDTEAWTFDSTRRALMADGMRMSAEPVLQQGKLLVVRTRGGS